MSEVSVTVTIMSGPDDGRKVCFRRSEGDGSVGAGGSWVLTLGRRDDCDICLPFDTQISRLHAQLRCTPQGDWFLEDCGSRNGTFVERKRIDGPILLQDGVLFRIGRTWLRVEHSDSDR